MSSEEEFKAVLETLSNNVDADNVGSVHAFFDQKPSLYDLDEKDLDYLNRRGLDGLENLGRCLEHLNRLRLSPQSNFSNFAKKYPAVRPDIEDVSSKKYTPIFYVSDSNSLRVGEVGKVASHLTHMGLAEKINQGTYRMIADKEDYRMVENVLNRVKENLPN